MPPHAVSAKAIAGTITTAINQPRRCRTGIRVLTWPITVLTSYEILFDRRLFDSESTVNFQRVYNHDVASRYRADVVISYCADGPVIVSHARR